MVLHAVFVCRLALVCS